MQVTVNGEPRAIDDDVTVAGLIALFQLAPERVAIEINERLVRRATFAETPVRAGDRIEIVTLVGGG